MYVLLPNDNIAHASTLGRRTGIYVLFGWGGSAHLAPWTINNYVILPNRSKVHTHARKVPFVWGGRAQLAPFVGQCGMHPFSLSVTIHMSCSANNATAAAVCHTM